MGGGSGLKMTTINHNFLNLNSIKKYLNATIKTIIIICHFKTTLTPLMVAFIRFNKFRVLELLSDESCDLYLNLPYSQKLRQRQLPHEDVAIAAISRVLLLFDRGVFFSTIVFKTNIFNELLLESFKDSFI